MASREVKDLLSVIKQRDAQLELAKGEAEERDHLLRATKHAIEQLQDELGSTRRDNEALKEEARKVRRNARVPAYMRNVRVFSLPVLHGCPTWCADAKKAGLTSSARVLMAPLTP